MPTGDFSATRAAFYVGGILIGTFLLAVPPLVFLKLKKPGWRKAGVTREGSR
jgi:hypothetical protein